MNNSTDALLLIIAGLFTLSFLIWLSNREPKQRISWVERKLVARILLEDRSPHDPCAVCLIKYRQEINLHLSPINRGDFVCPVCATEYEVEYTMNAPVIMTFRLTKEV